MSFTIIEIVKENHDKIEICRVLGFYSESIIARQKYDELKTLIENKIIIVADITMKDIPDLYISQFYE